MSGTRIVMNVPGYNAYRNSPEVTAAVEQVGQDLAERFGASVARTGLPAQPGVEDVSVRTSHSASRVQVYVSANSRRARLAEARDRLLLAALGSTS